MWISKKKYNELVKQKDDFERIAHNAVTQNGRLLDQWRDALDEMKSIQELNHQLVEHNEELLAHIKELEHQLKIRDARVEVLASRICAYEEGKAISREAE